ncbi:MAG: hypothetical protein M1828_007391 [Chrysothrix sp. TS-e1954]|nr:MAG: hypothetical protein M1828_007391 [Chrysothrix sp. TS-e1954]
MPFAQLVIGPPGAGKSTYCDGMHQFMAAIDRKCSVVNLDPANDHTNYPAALDVRDLITLEDIMEAEELGPNGGVLYALEELEHNIDWLEDGLKALGGMSGVAHLIGGMARSSQVMLDDYVLFDCPGQVELFTHHSSLRHIFQRLEKLGYRLVAIHLTDSYVLTLPTIYISALLLSLRSMLQMDLPHINVLTKIDNLASYPPLPLPLSFYTEARSLDHLLPFLEAEQRHEPIGPNLESDPTRSQAEDTATTDEEQPRSKFAALNEAIIELVDDFSLVGFETLAVEDRQSMTQLLRAIDRAGGYAFGASEGANDSVWQVAVREGGSAGFMEVRDIEERWVDRRAEFDELERKQWEEEAKAQRRPTGSAKASPANKSEEDTDLPKQPLEKDSGVKVVRKKPPP